MGKLCHFTESLDAFHGHPEFLLHFVKWEEDISRDVRAAPHMSSMLAVQHQCLSHPRLVRHFFPNSPTKLKRGLQKVQKVGDY